MDPGLTYFLILTGVLAVLMVVLLLYVRPIFREQEEARREHNRGTERI